LRQQSFAAPLDRLIGCCGKTAVVRVKHRALPTDALLDFDQRAVDQGPYITRRISRRVVAQHQLALLIDDRARRAAAPRVRLRVEQLGLAFERHAHLDAFAGNHDGATRVLYPTRLVVAHVHLRLVVIGVPLISQQAERLDTVLL
jgi:hypothetical protein